MTLTEPSPTAPAYGVVVLGDAADATDTSRLDAELNGRIAVGTQVLVVDVGDGSLLNGAALQVLASAAVRLQDERSGSLVLRNASSELLTHLRLLRLDHVFELEI
jgi:anti-anti-sigma regulatory factor